MKNMCCASVFSHSSNGGPAQQCHRYRSAVGRLRWGHRPWVAGMVPHPLHIQTWAFVLVTGRTTLQWSPSSCYQFGFRKVTSAAHTSADPRPRHCTATGLSFGSSRVLGQPSFAKPGWPSWPCSLAAWQKSSRWSSKSPSALGVWVKKHRLHLGGRQLQADIGELGPHCAQGCLQLQHDASAARLGAQHLHGHIVGAHRHVHPVPTLPWAGSLTAPL
ncbi:uncharacterized protein LOC144145105 isoform X1 [Haemaphysalis longicornis]